MRRRHARGHLAEQAAVENGPAALVREPPVPVALHVRVIVEVGGVALVRVGVGEGASEREKGSEVVGVLSDGVCGAVGRT